MNKIIRHQIADYLNTGTSQSPEWSLLGAGVTALDENPSAKIETTAYVSDRSASGTITGYENVFPFETQLISDEPAIRFIYDVARDQKTGSEAETDYVRVELFDPEGGGTTFPARKFRVAVEVSSVAGEGTAVVAVSGNLHQVGNFVKGTFDTSTKTFTEE